MFNAWIHSQTFVNENYSRFSQNNFLLLSIKSVDYSMFIQCHLILLLTAICSNIFAAIHDEEYIARNGPFGLIPFQKNDTFVDWIRVPEVHYKQWIYALKVWRTVR